MKFYKILKIKTIDFKKVVLLIFSCCFLFLIDAQSQIKLPELVNDHMILQRDAPIKLWGWASPNEKIEIVFNSKKVKTMTNSNGKWFATLPQMKAGGPYEMLLKGKNTINLKDILIGDVWLCSGQSNMVHQMGIHNIRYASEIAKANTPQIRQFWVPTATNMLKPNEQLLKSSWKSANPIDINDFSAVAYFFALNIYNKHQIPIGIINASVGGTPIEAWISEEGFSDFSDIKSTIAKNRDTAYINSRNRNQNPNSNVQPVDKGLTEKVKWYDTAYTPKGWRNIAIPGYWEDQGVPNLDGVVWFRKEIDIPVSMIGKEGRLFMGRIIDADVIYVNGKQIGSTGYQYPQRRYKIPANVLKAGKNLFVIKVQNNGGKGGFVPDKPYYLEVDNQTVDLKGYWDYKVGQVNVPSTGPRLPAPINAQNQPTALYNAMIAPFTNCPIKGVLWYQGESNIGSDYEKLLTVLTQNWRSKFNNPKLPFYYVQLPNYGDMNYLPTESGWAKVREAIFKSLKNPYTGMAVTIDLGEWNDIHPDNKKDIGERLAFIARHHDYNEKDLAYSGPLFKSATIYENKIIISFDHVNGGLISIDGEELSEFAIAGDDKKFVWAKAKIVGNTVEVWCDEVKQPKYVRYAWADNPVNPNLYNQEKLPASPFRTDK